MEISHIELLNILIMFHQLIHLNMNNTHTIAYYLGSCKCLAAVLIDLLGDCSEVFLTCSMNFPEASFHFLFLLTKTWLVYLNVYLYAL